jgi:hypothetical protein
MKRRDRIVVACVNGLLRLASHEYRTLMRGVIADGFASRVRSPPDLKTWNAFPVYTTDPSEIREAFPRND